MNLFPPNLPKSTRYLSYFLVFMCIYFTVSVGLFIIAALLRNDTLAIMAGIGMVSFLGLAFISAALGFILFGILSIIRKTTIVKNYPFRNIPSARNVGGPVAVVYGVAYTLAGVLFLAMLVSGTYAAFCSNSQQGACAAFSFVNIPIQIFSYTIKNYPWFWDNFKLIVTVIAGITFVTSLILHKKRQ